LSICLAAKSYTSKDVAGFCWDKILEHFSVNESFLEPSAGGGAFLRNDLDIEAYDLDPKKDVITKADYLEIANNVSEGKVVVGNPPFGFASSLALRFINESKGAKAVCFILPRTFQKHLFKFKVDNYLHLAYSIDLPENSFVLNGEPYDVPCCFQIWRRSTVRRERPEITSHVKEDKEGGLFLRRVGGRAGMFVNESEYTPSTTYRVSCSDDVKELVDDIYNVIKLEASKTAGVRSITLDEINYLIDLELNKLEAKHNE
jgi:hypothetical protein